MFLLAVLIDACPEYPNRCWLFRVLLVAFANAPLQCCKLSRHLSWHYKTGQLCSIELLWSCIRIDVLINIVKDRKRTHCVNLKRSLYVSRCIVCLFVLQLEVQPLKSLCGLAHRALIISQFNRNRR